MAKKYNLNMPDFSYESLKNDLTLIEAIRPFEDLLTQGAQLAEDTAAQAEHEAWQAFLTYYGILSNMAERNANIATEVSSMRECMLTARHAAAKQEPKPQGNAALGALKYLGLTRRNSRLSIALISEF